jgi:copper chaperone CopZ
MDTIETTYSVSGMTCGHCAGAVTGELERIDGVTGASVDLVAGTATISSERPIAEGAVRAAVEEAGYALGRPGLLPVL